MREPRICVARVVFRDLHELRLQFAAGSTPRGPETQCNDLAFERRERKRRTIQIAQHETEWVFRAFISRRRVQVSGGRAEVVISNEDLFAKPLFASMYLPPNIPQFLSDFAA